MGPALHLAPGGRLAALATRDASKSAPFRGIAPDLRVHDSYESLLADPEIDAVYIPLPNSMHVEWTLKALEAGKNVLTEKPIAMKSEEIDTLISARDRTGLLAAEAYMIVFHPQWQKVRDLIADGAIGTLTHVDGAFSFDNRDMENIRNKADAGGGALRDIGVYVIGATRFVTGEEPVEVSGRIRWENGIDIFSDISARFPGFTYSVYVSIRLAPRQELVFHGDKGFIRATVPFNAGVFGAPEVEVHGPGLTITSQRFPSERQYELQVAAFNQSVLTGADYPCPLEFVRGTQAMMDKVFANASALK